MYTTREQEKQLKELNELIDTTTTLEAHEINVDDVKDKITEVLNDIPKETIIALNDGDLESKEMETDLRFYISDMADMYANEEEDDEETK